MPWNGAGLFTRLRSWVTDQTNGLSIQADLMDTDTNDIAAGIQGCLAKNGENAPTANLPMGGFKHTGVADGAARTHYASLGQVQDGSALYCVAAGTANALTLAYSPAITALVDGQELRFKAFATNTGAATAAINAIAAKNITRPGGGALVAGDLVSGQGYLLRYVSSSDALVLMSAVDSGLLTGVATFSSGALTLDMAGRPYLEFVYTATANITSLVIANAPSNAESYALLRLTNGGAYTVANPPNSVAAGGVYYGVGALTAAGTDELLYRRNSDGSRVVVSVKKDIKA